VLLTFLVNLQAQSTNCNLAGYFTDVAQSQPVAVSFELTTQVVSGETVPATLSLTFPNPSNGFFYTAVSPAGGPQALCDLPTISNSMFLTFGFAYVTPPAVPHNLNMFHFYMWPQSQINQILPTDAGWADCPNWQPNSDIVPPGSVLFPAGVCVPTMGGHFLTPKMDQWDPSSLIPVWGGYNQTVIFYEFLSLDGMWDHLATIGNSSYTEKGDFPLPRFPQKTGWYPATAAVALVGSTQGQVQITLSNFEYLLSSTDWSAQLQAKYDSGVADGKATCTNPICNPAAALVAQLLAFVLPFLLYFF